MPESWSNCGELNAPPHEMISVPRTTWSRRFRRYSIPTARVALEDDPVGLRTGDDRQVGAVDHRVQVGTGSAEATAAANVLVERCEALLTETVDVVGEAESGLRPRLEPRPEQRVRRRAPFEFERSVTTAPIVGPSETGLHPLEIGQAMAIAPVAHPGPLRPLVVVHRDCPRWKIMPLMRARSTQHLATGVVHPPAAHVGFGLALVLPVVEPTADRVGERGRHVDEHIPLPVGATGLEHQHPIRCVGAQPVRERTTRRTATDDDEVVLGRIRHRVTIQPGASR